MMPDWVSRCLEGDKDTGSNRAGLLKAIAWLAANATSVRDRIRVAGLCVIVADGLRPIQNDHYGFWSKAGWDSAAYQTYTEALLALAVVYGRQCLEESIDA